MRFPTKNRNLYGRKFLCSIESTQTKKALISKFLIFFPFKCNATLSYESNVVTSRQEWDCLFVHLFDWMNLFVSFVIFVNFLQGKGFECNVAQFKRCMVVVDDAHSIYDGNEWKTMKMDKLILLVMLTCEIRKDFAKKFMWDETKIWHKQTFDCVAMKLMPKKKSKSAHYLPTQHAFVKNAYVFSTTIFLLHNDFSS